MFPLEIRQAMHNKKNLHRDAFRAAAIATDTRMLVIDNDRQIGMALNFMLTARGYEEIRVVRSASRGIAVAGQFLPGMVFLDLELPDMSSIGLAQQLRRNARQQSMRLIALTGDAEHGMREEARQAGFERFLTKPVTNEELDKILGRPASVTT